MTAFGSKRLLSESPHRLRLLLLRPRCQGKRHGTNLRIPLSAADVHDVEPQRPSPPSPGSPAPSEDNALVMENVGLPAKQDVLRPGRPSGRPSLTPPVLVGTVRWFEKRPDRFTGLILLNIMAFLCGANWVVVKQAGELLDPLVFAALRFWIAATACLPFLLKTKHSSSVTKAGVELGAYMAGGYLFQSLALLTADASRAALLSTFTVLTVPVLAALNGTKVKPLVWLCCLGSIAGTSLLEQSGQPPNVGDLLAVVSAIFFGVQLYRTEILSKELPSSAALPVTAVAMLTVAVGASAAAVTQHSTDLGPQVVALAAHVPHLTWADVGAAWGQVQGLGALPWSELIFTGIFATVAVLLIEMLALNTVSSTEAAIIYTAEPVWGALLAYFFLGERWGVLGWVGAFLITSCSLATQLGGAEAETAEVTEVDVK